VSKLKIQQCEKVNKKNLEKNTQHSKNLTQRKVLLIMLDFYDTQPGNEAME